MVHPGLVMVSVNGYKLQTTMEMGEMPCAFRSSSSDWIVRARIPIEHFLISLLEQIRR
jgi:hypothetical protein